MQNKVKSNIIYQLLYQTLVVAFPIIVTPIVSRALGKEYLGIYSYTYSIAYYFSLFAALGIFTYGTRIIAYNREDKEKLSSSFWELYSIQIVLSILTSLVYVIYAVTLGKVYMSTALCQGTTILMTMVDITWYFQGVEEFKTMVIRNAFIKILSLVLIVLLVKNPGSINAYVLILNLSSVVGQFIIWPSAIKVVGKPRFTFNNFKEHMPFALKLFVPLLALNASILVDKVMLGVLSSMGNVGYYENIDRIIKMPVGLALAAITVLFSRAAYNESHGKVEENKETIYKTINILWMLSFPIALGLVAVADKLVPWYLGDDFIPCGNFLKCLAFVVPLLVTESVLRLQYFVPKGEDRTYINGVVIGTVINLVINAMTIKSYGVYGVIAGTLACELFGAVFLMVKASRDIKWTKLAGSGVYYIIASGVMYVVITLLTSGLKATPLTTVIQFVIGVVTYSVLVLPVFIKKVKK